jgi:TolB-like protein
MESAGRFALADRDPFDAGRQLGAAWVLDGAMQRHGDHVRVDARLLSLADGSIRWTGSFDVTADRVSALQDDISDEVTRALNLHPQPFPIRAGSPCEGPGR